MSIRVHSPFVAINSAWCEADSLQLVSLVVVFFVNEEKGWYLMSTLGYRGAVVRVCQFALTRLNPEKHGFLEALRHKGFSYFTTHAGLGRNKTE